MEITTSSTPRRGIYSEPDLDKFKASEVCKEINNFVRLCADAVAGKKISESGMSSEVIIRLEAFIVECGANIESYPPIKQPMRFGNKAFRHWHAHLQQRAPEFIRELLPTDKHSVIEEVAAYLSDSFGNERRIDYGTGHETNFALFLLCLVKLRVVDTADLSSLILRVFSVYIKVMRMLQQTYLLEPAGSHGVWGLDDYHCLIYVWGSAQLMEHPEITPRDVRDANLVRANAEEYMYMEGISTIYTIKSTAPFAETSPMLYSVSELRDWRAVRNGMLKLYMGEVLNKLPVVQHLLFGTLLPCTWSPTLQVDPPRAPHVSGGLSVPALPHPARSTPQRPDEHNVLDEAATRAPWAT